MKQNVHGGDIYRNKIADDFSVNINPIGVPQKVTQALLDAVGKIQQYPDIMSADLIGAIAQKKQFPKEQIVCGNGASELFMGIVHAYAPRKICIPVPSFYGYEWAAESQEAKVVYYSMKKEENFCLTERFLESLDEETDLVFLANPNNPTGKGIDQGLLTKIAVKCREKEILIVLDECFLEFTDRESFFKLHDAKKYPNVIVVNAFTKLYAIPGVRLGYALTANVDVAEKLKRQLPEWNLSVFAQLAGVCALQEDAYVEETREVLRKQKQYLEQNLSKFPIEVLGGEANYLFLFTELPLYEDLLKKHILVRDCSNYSGLKKGYYRIAVKEAEENKRLIQTLEKLYGQIKEV